MLAALALTACSGLTPSANGPILLHQVPASATQCALPVDLPATSLTQSEVEKLWATDRVNLVRCYGSVEALKAYIENLQKEFNGAVK